MHIQVVQLCDIRYMAGSKVFSVTMYGNDPASSWLLPVMETVRNHV